MIVYPLTGSRLREFRKWYYSLVERSTLQKVEATLREVIPTVALRLPQLRDKWLF